MRPATKPTLSRDLSVTKIRSLDDIDFTDASAFGVRTTNLAAMHKFSLPKGTVPDGFVAVTTDVLHQTGGNYYLNVQIGEDLVTHPEEQSIPEEVLLGWWEEDGSKVMQHSNQLGDDERILQAAHLNTLRKCLGKDTWQIRKALQGRSPSSRFRYGNRV